VHSEAVQNQAVAGRPNLILRDGKEPNVSWLAGEKRVVINEW
jgi:hypothetical protein